MGEPQSLRNRLAELDAIIPVLQRERKLILRKLNALKYPVLKLPSEVTAEIFVFCLPPIRLSKYEDSCHVVPHSVADAPLLFLRVCRAWRDIALATPRLWASIRLPSGGRWRPFDSWLSWLARAGSCPLSLALRPPRQPLVDDFRRHIPTVESWDWDDAESYYPGSPPPEARAEKFDKSTRKFEDLDRFFQELLERAAQWYDVDLFSTYEELLEHHARFKSALHGNLHVLERLKLNYSGEYRSNAAFYRYDDDDSTPVTITVFERAPKLHDVFLIYLPPSFIVLPWAQLTSFTGEYLSLRNCLEVLRLTPHLIECSFGKIYLPHDDDPADVLPVNVALNRLQSFTIYGTEEHRMDLLSALTLPKLTKLHHLPRVPKTFIDFLSRSSPKLHELSTGRCYATLLEALPLIPSLAVLSIHPFCGPLRDVPDFMPNLQSLEICVDTPDGSGNGSELGTSLDSLEIQPEDLETTLDYEVLADALRVRWGRPHARLAKFSLTWLDPHAPSSSLSEFIVTEDDIGLRPDPDILERLSDLADDGMKIYLGSRTMSWL
ncbi:hypothetical protein MSAN_01388500 [Mycena sanguinolenta]|uniref:F-box domain-containing protein n=1 Tax=Mycena sanguinolenta TaxID=230812 RepID=A0A8H7CY08_9AGAR|nr:hypothetical protein MSAN_01388500 [Mycena sanguinolenta]